MSWFNIIKFINVDILQHKFPKAKVKNVGNTWKLLFKKEEDFNNALDLIRTEQEDTGIKWNAGTSVYKDLWIINFENKREMKEWI